MSSSQPVPPLRIQKGTSSSGSPVKNSTPRPLSELGPTAQRRNSPSYNQAAKRMALNGDSSPFQSSPFTSAEGSSPHLFWQSRDPGTPNRISTENLFKDSSISPTRKSSIERLQRASRVKNSTMYAREQKLEYDPMSIPVVERPLAKNIQGNAYGGKGLEGLRSSEQNRSYGHAKTDSKSSLSLASPPPLNPIREPLKIAATNGLRSPSKDQISPTKSSMATSRFTGKALYDPEHNAFGEDDSGDERELPPGRTLHRHAKSVTFDVAPPQINEYELATPDISSIGTGSRENSYDSEEEEDDEDLYYHGDGLEQDDSFDASLEDIEKTPVVGPDDWRHSSPGNTYGTVSGYYDDPFEGPEGSPMPDARPSSSSGRPNATRNDSSEHRPLPPLPGMAGNDRRGSASSGIERAATNSPRNLPTPPPPASISKADLQGMNGNKLTLEERLHLMMIQDDDRPKSSEGRPKSAERDEQRERRMRRAGARKSQTPERESQPIKIHEDREDQEDHEDEDTLDDLPGLGSYQLPPRISRESILRKVNGQEPFSRESDYNLDSPLPSSSPERPSTAQLAELDPDTPIPSTEVESVDEDLDDENSVMIKSEAEEDDDDVDIYAIPDMYQRTESGMESHQDESEVGTVEDEDDDMESHYSDETPSEMPLHESPQFQSNSVPEDDGPPTPRNISPSSISMDPAKENKGISLPEFSGLLTDNTDFGLSLRSYMTPSPPLQEEKGERKVSKMSDAHEYLQGSETPEADEEVVHQTQVNEPEESDEETDEDTPLPQENVPEPQEEFAATAPLKKMISRPEYDGSEWGPQEDEDDDEISDSESVIRHPVDEPIDHPFRASIDRPFRSSIDQPFKSSIDQHPFIDPPKISPTPPPPSDSPGIPETLATIKARSGSKLKTRPSVTPSDISAMREARRQVSGTGPPAVPSVPQRHRSRPSMDGERDFEDDDIEGGTLQRNPSFKKRSLTLDIGGDLGLNLESDFDRVIESSKVAYNLSSTHSTFFTGGAGQASEPGNLAEMSDHANKSPRQRGYLMRQNTKVVVASSDEREPRGAKSAGNSPTKADNRPQSWVVEPWNGSRKSNSRPSSPRKKPPTGSVPPMPGHESNAATGLGILTEGQVADPVSDEGSERGRLFVKVIGVKDLDLPLPKNERSWFSLTLDNGVHCVTTAWLELGKNAPIGQEFELVVPNELEFQLTLNAKLEKPAPPKRIQTSPVKATKPSKPSTFSRVFASPKKRKELEMRQKEEEQRIAQQKQQDAQALKKSSEPTAWDLLSPLAAADGSFGRSYVCLKDHETRCFGRPYNVDVAAFNEWATEETNQSSSVMSKRSVPPPVRKRAPYTVGKLQLQLLFVPKPKGASDEDMPKSMNACIREMKEAELEVARQFEGHLSQQGGDCPFWRRRFFRLAGSKLTAYHESTRQPRVTINLANANRLIDDRRALTQKETTAKAGKRRKSGFAEDEEGYMFVEEGFRIRFNNGEVIDFYADSTADKEAWMSVLDPCVGKERAGGKGGWCEMVLKREEHMMRKASGTSGKGRSHTRVKSTII
ncbi:Bud site selection protein bud4 [Ciborinia camelliae]|nr:Bud site selection protein bud4 [Ciborinia camelliae]